MRTKYPESEPLGAEQRLLKTDEAAEILRLSTDWLHRARSKGKGPRFVRLGRIVFYRRSDLLEYVENSLVETVDTRR